MDHDYYFWSFFMGDPGLHSGFLHYFDGKNVLICGRNLNQKLSIEKYAKSLKAIVEYYRQNYKGIEYIEIWGVDPRVQTTSLMEILPWTYSQPNPFNVDMVIDLGVYDPRQARHYRYGRTFKSQCNELRIHRPKFLSASHIRLINQFFREHELDAFDLVYYGMLQGLMRAGHALVFEAWGDNEELMGFSVVNTFFQQHPIFLMGFYDHQFSHVCDFLYLSIFEYFRYSHAKYLDLGYSINENLHTYKMRWMPSLVLDTRGSLAWEAPERKTVFYHWFPPLVVGEITNHVN
jgi:hypothetical protein